MRTILLLDDREDVLAANVRLLRSLLPESEWRVATLSSSLQAIIDISRRSTAYDVVISDYMMPRHFGDEVVAVARRCSAKTFCILLSGTTGDAEKANQNLPEDHRAHHVVEKSPDAGIPRVVELIRARFATPSPSP